MRIGYFRFPTKTEIFNPQLMRWYGYGVFRNMPYVKPGRWGFYAFGFEFGSRNPGDTIGIILKRCGLWPW